jgi:hypothetical protein
MFAPLCVGVHAAPQEFKLSSMAEVVKILQFQSRTESGFRRNPTAFASVLNMALYHHTVSLNYAEVRAAPNPSCTRPTP